MPFPRWLQPVACCFARLCLICSPWGAASAAAPEAEGGNAHWAYQPLRETVPPPSSGWARSPIDALVEARLREAGLQPSPDADRRDLLRRVSFQLVGLPPSPAEVRDFAADTRSDALERVVDRLLASPEFGVRWGRHWLDLARYADSNGLDENFLFREAWRYRNWVIGAVNADQPFDRFTLEQIAGDLLPFDTVAQRDRQRIAAGFLVIGPKVLLGNDPRRQRMEVADEQIDTIGKTFLAQTLGCARCHDHKFDPVPTADYYALAGILTSTQVMEQRYMLGEQRVMEQLVGLGEGGDELDARYESFWRELPQIREQAARARSALEALEKGDTPALESLTQQDPDALSPVARDGCRPLEERLQAQRALVQERDAAASPPPIPPRAMIPADADSPGDEPIRLRGQFDQPGETVPRGFLRALGQPQPAAIPEGQSGRIQLAQWLTDVDGGAGALTARVMANRVWRHLLGRGIVRTVDNFGRTGESPSHPELLDHLAREWIASGWSVKALVRSIVLSRTFGMSSAADPRGAAVDPDNALLWRAHRRRLDPECLRDAMLSVAGQLDLRPADSTVSYLGDQATAVGKNEVRRRTDSLSRSIYLPMIRNDLPELFEAFDFADPHATTGARPETSDATQGLFLLNDAMVMQTAEAAARRLVEEMPNASPAERLDRLCQRSFGASPSPGETAALLAFLQETEDRLAADGSAEPEWRAWSLTCHALFALSRFQFLE